MFAYPILLEAMGFLMPFHSTGVAHFVGATIAGIAPFTFACHTTMQIPLVLHAFFCPTPADFTARPALVAECTDAFDRREMILFLISTPFISPWAESLDLGHIIAQPFKIGDDQLLLIQDQPCIHDILILTCHQHEDLTICLPDLVFVHDSTISLSNNTLTLPSARMLKWS